MDDEIHELFSTEKISDEQKTVINDIRVNATEFLNYLERVVPTGRRLFIAKTKLEEAMMFAIKAICKPDNSDCEADPTDGRVASA